MAAPEPFRFYNTVNANSTIYSDLGIKEIDNKNLFTILTGMREREQKRLLNLT